MEAVLPEGLFLPPPSQRSAGFAIRLLKKAASPNKPKYKDVADFRDYKSKNHIARDCKSRAA